MTGVLVLSEECNTSVLVEEEEDDHVIASIHDQRPEEQSQLLLPPPDRWFHEDEEESEEEVENCTYSPPPVSNIMTNGPSILAYSATTTHTTLSSSSMPPPTVVKKAPSWKELSSQVLPAAARELLSSSMRRVYHTARIQWANRNWHRRYSDLGSNVGGYFVPDSCVPLQTAQNDTSVARSNSQEQQMPRFSSLNWVDRQLVSEWRTVEFGIRNSTSSSSEISNDDDDDDDHHEEEDDDFFDKARTLVPQPRPRPVWRKAEVCHACHKPFGPTLLRHHCRNCGFSFCHLDSSRTHRLPHLGYDTNVPERVCENCKRQLTEENLAERVAWRLARCRDYFSVRLTPYFETGVDTVEDAALRITRAALAMARRIPLGAQAHVAVETVEVLRQHGLKGIYTLILRKEFLEAADLLCRALGINKTAWPLSVHELSAAIFYALAQHRAMRGLSPEREQLIHTFRNTNGSEGQDQENYGDLNSSVWIRHSVPCIPEEEGVGSPNSSKHDFKKRNNSGISDSSVMDETDAVSYDADLLPMADQPDASVALPTNASQEAMSQEELPFSPVCDPVSDAVLSSLLFYAPIALNFIYVERQVDMQLLAAQQGWILVYAHLEQDQDVDGTFTDRPASALFVHEEQKIACFAVRGTATINDVVTDIRQTPVPFPETESDLADNGGSATRFEDDWTPVFPGQGLAVCGMARAAVTLYREHIDALVLLAQQGYKIRLVGHSMGGSVATLLGALVLRHIEQTGDVKLPVVDNSTTSSRTTAEGPDATVDVLHVFGYGTPSCVDAKLSEIVKPFVTTVVLHDDVVPRLTPTSIRGLLKHLLHIRETWVKAHLADDLVAITERAKTAWAPRWRQSFMLSSSTSFKRYCHKQIRYGQRKLLSVKGKLVGSDNNDQDLLDDVTDLGSLESDSKDEVDDMMHYGFDEPHSSIGIPICEQKETRSRDEEPKGVDAEESAQEPAMLVDYMGCVGPRVEGIVIDGDEFFDTEENLVESDREVSDENSQKDDDDVADVSAVEHVVVEARVAAAPSTVTIPTGEDDSWVPFEDHPEHRTSLAESGLVSTESRIGDCDDNDEADSPSPSAVMLEEAPLPRMFLPGKIVHIYTYRGVFKAAFVPRAFKELRRISLAGNMLSDHTCAAYYEALLEVRSVRSAQEDPPRWTAFDEDHTCSCCASRFTWASTSDSKAQEARDKHNCRSCGSLVCDPCSSNRIPLPSIGIFVPVRVCDRCYNDIGGVLFTGECESPLTSRIRGHHFNEASQDLEIQIAKPERRRERRSRVVDELASRIQSPVTCS